MSARTCTACQSRPINDDRYACASCVQTFRDHITRLPDLLDDLNIAATRQARFTDDGPRLTGTTNQPLPYDPRASEIRHALLAAVLLAVHHTRTQRGEFNARVSNAAHYLDVRANWLATHEDGVLHLAGLTALMRRALAIVDRPPDRTYVGPCTATTIDPDNPTRGTECGTELYTTPGRDHVTCPRCHHTYPVQDRRTWLLNASWEAIATGPDIARALAGHAYGNIHINLSTLRWWAAQGNLPKRGTRRGRPLYRLGDVITLATHGTPQKAESPT